MSRSSFLVVGLLTVSLSSGLIACDGANPAGDDVVDAAGTSADSAIPAGWTSLLEGDWSLQPGQEGYYCVYATVPRDVYIKAFRPLGPQGTHHPVLTTYSGTTPDILKAVRLARQVGATVIALTGLGRTPLTRLAHHTLSASAPGDSYRPESLAVRLPQLSLLDALFTSLHASQEPYLSERLARARASRRHLNSEPST